MPMFRIGPDRVESRTEVVRMPFRSAKQRRFMFAKHPKIARRWAKEYGTKPRGKKRGN